MPIIYWIYCPNRKLPDHMLVPQLYRRGGVVGAMQNSALLNRMGIKFSTVIGSCDDERLNADLEDYCRAYAAWKGLRNLRVGQICGRFDDMMGTYTDEFRMMTQLGVELVPVTLQMLKSCAEELTEPEIREFMDTLKSRCDRILVDDEDLYYAARVSLAVGRATEKYSLGAIAVQDFDSELNAYFKTRPQLWVPGLAERKVVISMEGDVMAAITMWISRQMGETTPMYCEMFSYDLERNGAICGHATMMDPAMAGDNPITLTTDGELDLLGETKGAWTCFVGKPGEVVFNSLYTKEGKYVISQFGGRAESLPLLDVYQNVFVRFASPLQDMFKKLMYLGTNQHFSLSYDNIRERWRKFAEISGIEITEID